MDLTQTAAHECSIIIGMGCWTAFANITIKYLALPGSVPMNLVYSYAAVSPRGSGPAMQPYAFTWLSHLIRIATDLALILVGLVAYDLMLSAFDIDYRFGEDPTILMRETGDLSIGAKLFMLILIYISHLTMLGSWRLGWNAGCVPFLHVYLVVMEYLFPQGPPP